MNTRTIFRTTARTLVSATFVLKRPGDASWSPAFRRFFMDSFPPKGGTPTDAQHENTKLKGVSSWIAENSLRTQAGRRRHGSPVHSALLR